jgi:hypothetical protein
LPILAIAAKEVIVLVQVGMDKAENVRVIPNFGMDAADGGNGLRNKGAAVGR